MPIVCRLDGIVILSNDMHSEKQPSEIIFRPSFKIMLFSFLQREKEFLPNVRLEKLSQEEQERMAPILKYLDDNSIITNAIGRDLLGKSVATTKRYLNRLCEVGILEQKSAGRSSYYERK